MSQENVEIVRLVFDAFHRRRTTLPRGSTRTWSGKTEARMPGAEYTAGATGASLLPGELLGAPLPTTPTRLEEVLTWAT